MLAHLKVFIMFCWGSILLTIYAYKGIEESTISICWQRLLFLLWVDFELSSSRCYCKLTLSTCAGLWRTRRRLTTTAENVRLTLRRRWRSRSKWSLQSPKLSIWSKWKVMKGIFSFMRFNLKFSHIIKQCLISTPPYWIEIAGNVGISQDFKWKTVFNQRRGAAWGPQGFLWRVKIIFKFELLRKTWGKKIKFQTIDLSPGILSSKPSKLNKDFAEPRWWRTSSAPLVPPLLLLSTGSLGCTTSCFLAERGKCKGNIALFAILAIHWK